MVIKATLQPYSQINLIMLMSLNQLFNCQECTTSSADLTKVSASIIINLPCQERVFSAGQRLPHVIREDQKVSRGTAEIQQSQMESYTLPRHGTWTSGITSATRSKCAKNRADKLICILHLMQRMLQIAQKSVSFGLVFLGGGSSFSFTQKFHKCRF